MKVVTFLVVGLMLTGCAVRTGILVNVGDGSKPLLGEAVATVASGTFKATNLDGLVCDGTYDQWSQSPALRVEVTCNDGRRGQVIVLRTGRNLANGSGEGRLNDGTVFRVLLGDMAHYQGAEGVWKKAD
jgi:hypothetical protein